MTAGQYDSPSPISQVDALRRQLTRAYESKDEAWSVAKAARAERDQLRIQRDIAMRTSECLQRECDEAQRELLDARTQQSALGKAVQRFSDRAEAAERRVQELESALSGLIQTIDEGGSWEPSHSWEVSGPSALTAARSVLSEPSSSEEGA